MKLSGAITILLLTLLAGCATKEPVVAPKPAPGPAPEATKPATGAEPEVYSRLVGRKIKPNAVKPINVKADCSFRDPTGYGGKLNIHVENSLVRLLQADLQVPKRGNCAFVLKDFRQTANEPSVTLSAASGNCVVRLWEQEGRVTVAFNSCRDRCQSDAFDYVWPIQVDPRTGSCS
jgi:hypothetical protein